MDVSDPTSPRMTNGSCAGVMSRRRGFQGLRHRGRITALLVLCVAAFQVGAQPLPNTTPLTLQGDLSVQMVAGIDRFLENDTKRVAAESGARWQPDLNGDRSAYERSVQSNRERFAQMIGLIDVRVKSPELEYTAT